MDICSGKFNIISICSGIGGLDLGIHIANPRAKTVCYVEREAYSAATLVARMEDQTMGKAPIWDDLTTFDGKPWRGKVDCIIAGFPCQPWSTAGKRKGVSDDRWLWDDIWQIICAVRPKYVFMENVTGLLHNSGLGAILGSLAEGGYDAEWGCFSAEECGFSHKRERLFILAKLGDTKGINARQGEQKIFKSGFSGASDGFCEESSHTDNERLQRHEQVDASTSGSTPKFHRTYFLPRLSSERHWRRILDQEPSLEPGIYRAADGSPDWVVEANEFREDRIRALGNGVVPLVAAYAFKMLMRNFK